MNCKCAWYKKQALVIERAAQSSLLDEPMVQELGPVEEILPPWRYSQTGVVGFGADIHSCAVIGTMICFVVLRGAVTLPKDVDDSKLLIDSFVEIRKNGNAFYDNVSASAINIDLTVEEVIEHSELQLIMLHGIIAIDDAQNLETHLYQLSETQKSFACVLIIYPNLSITITARNGIISAFDSHCHFMKGASTMLYFCLIQLIFD